jgi:hypothetical protein
MNAEGFHGCKRRIQEKVKREDDGGYKVERELKDGFGNKIKEKHEKIVDQQLFCKVHCLPAGSSSHTTNRKFISPQCV